MFCNACSRPGRDTIQTHLVIILNWFAFSSTSTTRVMILSKPRGDTVRNQVVILFGRSYFPSSAISEWISIKVQGWHYKKTVTFFRQAWSLGGDAVQAQFALLLQIVHISINLEEYAAIVLKPRGWHKQNSSFSSHVESHLDNSTNSPSVLKDNSS